MSAFEDLCGWADVNAPSVEFEQTIRAAKAEFDSLRARLSAAEAAEATVEAMRAALLAFPEWKPVPTRSVGGMNAPREPLRCLFCGAFHSMGPEPKHDPGCPWNAAKRALAASPRPTPPEDAPATDAKGPGYDLSIHSNPDASAWARFFAETFPPGSPAPDEATMLGWFANAMMAQHDHDLREISRRAPAPASPPSAEKAEEPSHG